MPLGFERVRGELAIYCERGDILFHDAYLWHSAARATDDASRRRHIRGSWYTGQPLDPDDDATEAFVKNAAR
jgi:ectoine hydroxylase-related dioxygenase (phytanoyl-CoA dioxygenase family)